MPITSPPWVAEALSSQHFRVTGGAGSNGQSNLICIVNGQNTQADAALIARAPDFESEARATLADLYLVEMVLSELRRAVNLDREVRVIVPTLKRVHARQASARAVLTSEEAV
jgi:hypothetical protein